MGLKNPRAWSDTHFRTLLAWLDPDPDKAGVAYAQLHRRLQLFFEGSRDAARYAEELADATIDRALSKITEEPQITARLPAAYLRTVATFILKEYRAQAKSVPLTADPPDPQGMAEDEGIEAVCLRRCLSRLPAKDYKLIIGYYAADKGESTSWRNTVLPRLLGRSYGAIRVQVMRIRRLLQDCVEECAKRPRSAGYDSAEEGRR